MSYTNNLGKWGEELALSYLNAKGHQLSSQNYRYKHAEIDLITVINKTLVFTEVKTRSGTGFGKPESFVDYGKVKLIMKAAENYIFQIDWQFDIRFDIISILKLPDDTHQIHHIEDAFY